MESEESLFSLEVAIDALKIGTSTVCCRLPAVAFRLLDFPSLVIHQLDVQLRQQLRNSLYLDSGNDLPIIFEELLNREKAFQFDKGKSCLFKFQHSSLHSHLQNTPLYIMVMDMWPDVPKLVGVCSISVVDEISKIENDIKTKGLFIPCAHGSQGCFPIYNLMGTQIGWIKMGYRLLSLGTSLISHIPEQSLSNKPLNLDSQNVKKNIVNETGAFISNKKSGDPIDIINHDDMHLLVTNSKVEDISSYASVQRVKTVKNLKSKPPADPTGLHVDAALEIPNEKSVFDIKPTQTLEASNTKYEGQLRSVPGENENIYSHGIGLVNTHCPPPLYFIAESICSEGVGSVGHQQEGIAFDKIRKRQFEETEEKTFEVGNEGSSFSSDDLHSRLVETRYQYREGVTSVRKMLLKSREDVHEQFHSVDQLQPVIKGVKEEHFKEHELRLNAEVDLIGSEQQLPVLMALLNELSILTDKRVQGFRFSRQKDVSEKENVPPTNASFIPANEIFDTPRTKREDRHLECLNTPFSTPKKGWLREQPKSAIHRKNTKLHFKMTNSQKLRLRKNNPELLRSIELKEEKMTMEQGMKDTKRRDLHKSGETINTRHSKKRFHPTIQSKKKLKSKAISESEIPTPRLRLSRAPDVQQQQTSKYEDSAIKAHFNVNGNKEKEIPQNGRNTPRGIEVFVPDASGPVSDDDDTESEEDYNPAKGLRREYRIYSTPGFPPDDPHSDKNTKMSNLIKQVDSIVSQSPEISDFLAKQMDSIDVSRVQDGVQDYSDNFDEFSEGTLSSQSRNREPSDQSSNDSKSSYKSFAGKEVSLDDSKLSGESQVGDSMENLSMSKRLSGKQELRGVEVDLPMYSMPSSSSQSSFQSAEVDLSQHSQSTSQASKSSMESNSSNNGHKSIVDEGKSKVKKPETKVGMIVDLSHIPPQISPRAAPRKLGIPQPKLSSMSPIPQPRAHKAHIIMNKPLDTNLSASDEVMIPELSMDFALTPRPGARFKEPVQERFSEGDIDSEEGTVGRTQGKKERLSDQESSPLKSENYSDDFQSDGYDSQ